MTFEEFSQAENEPDLSPEAEKNLGQIRRLASLMSDTTNDTQLFAGYVQHPLNQKPAGPLFKKLFQLLEKECPLTPLIEESAGFRGKIDKPPATPEFWDQTDLIVKLVMGMDDGSLPSEHLEALNTLVNKESETWLDVAFIRAAVLKEITGVGAIEYTTNVARFFVGEDSRIQKNLERYFEQFFARDIKSIQQFGIGALGCVAEAVGAAILNHYYEHHKFELNAQFFTILLVSLAAIATSAWGIRDGVKHFNNPKPNTSRYTRKQYEKLVPPKEVQRFVELAFEIYELNKELEITIDVDDKAYLTKELESLTEEAKNLIKQKETLFSAVARHENENHNKIEVIEAEFEDEAPAKQRVAVEDSQQTAVPQPIVDHTTTPEAEQTAIDEHLSDEQSIYGTQTTTKSPLSQ